MIDSLHNSIFYEKPEVVSSAPGKINLMGEHTYQSAGFVFSIAINHRTYVSLSSRFDEKFVVYSDRALALEIFTKKSLGKIEKNKWITPVIVRRLNSSGDVEEILKFYELDKAIDDFISEGSFGAHNLQFIDELSQRIEKFIRKF